MSSHGTFILVLGRFCPSSLEQLSSSLLGSGSSLSLKQSSSSLLTSSLPRWATVSVSTALPCWSMVEGASLGIGFVSAAVDRIIPLDESWDEVYRLKPFTRNEFCCDGLIVKSSIFPTWPMLLMSCASWLNETPRSSQLSWTTAVKEQQCWEYGRNVTSVSVGKRSSDDLPWCSGCCSHVASLYPWFVAPKVLAKEIDPLHWRLRRLRRLLNPDQERSVISDSVDGV
jgi:hypothetical protein